MESLLLRFEHLNALQIGLLATGLLLEGAIVAVAPEEVIVLTLGYAWGHGRISFAECWACVLAGLLPANFFMFSVGRRFGPAALKRRPLRWFISEIALAKARVRAERHGPLLTFITRFTPAVRGPVYLALGTSGLAPSAFFLSDATAAQIQVPMLLMLGRLGASNWGWFAAGIVVLVAGAALATARVSRA